MPPKPSQHGAQSGSNSSITRLTSSLSKIRKARACAAKPKLTSLKNRERFSKNVDTKVVAPESTIQHSDTSSPTVAFNLTPTIEEQIISLTQANTSLQQQVDRLTESNRQAHALNSAYIGASDRFDANTDHFTYLHKDSLSEHHRFLDRMLRHMPEFNGKANDNFESYIVGVDAALVYGVGCTEKQKLAAVKIKIGGDARQVLANFGTVETVAKLISVMRETYGQDQRSLIADVKQKSNEPVRVFATRLRSILAILGWSSNDSQKPSLVSLEFFLNGLLPYLAADVKRMLPRTIELAINYAIQLESMSTLSNIDGKMANKSK